MMNFAKLNKEDQFYNIKLQTIQNERLASLETAEKIDGNKKKNRKRTKLVDFSERQKKPKLIKKLKALLILTNSTLPILNHFLSKKTQKLI